MTNINRSYIFACFENICSYFCHIHDRIPGEVAFGDASYTVLEGTEAVNIKVVRRGYLGNIVSVGKIIEHSQKETKDKQTKTTTTNKQTKKTNKP